MNEDRRFLEDLSEPLMLHAALVRSPCAHGELLGIDAPRLPHSYALIKAGDIPGKNRLDAFGRAMPVLADDELSYKGEAIAIAVGPDRFAVEKLAGDCVVRFREDTPVFAYEKFSSDQLEAKRTAVVGDPDAAFESAAHIVEGVYRTGRQEHWYAEPHGALARFAYDKLEISVATQWPFHVRRTVASVLGVKPEDVVVLPCEIGTHLDGKLWYPSLVAAFAAVAAVVSKRPVRILFTRGEDARFSPKRPAVTIRHRAAVGPMGELIALESRAVVDIGAASPFAEEIIDRLCLGSFGAYRCPHIRVEGFAVRTNTPPAGPFAGFGLAQAFFAIERHADRIAETVGADPVEWRQSHALGKSDRLASGALLKENVPSAELMDSVITMSDYRRKWSSYELMRHSRAGKEGRRKDGPLRGIGISFAYQGNGFLSTGTESGSYSVETTLEKDGTLEIRTSAVCGSRETAALWRRTASELLALDDEAVRLAPNRTDAVPDSGPSSLSRNVTVVTKLIERCCAAIRKQRFRDPLPITVKRSYRSPKSAEWDGIRMEGLPFSLFSWAAAVVEVEIDPVDYEPKVRGVWLSVDGGRILSDRKARSSLTTGVLHSIGWATRERAVLSDGAYDLQEMLSYDLAVPSEAPPVRIDFTWNDSSVPKGIGELPFSCVPAALVQAVSQAAGRGLGEIPIDAAAIRDALEEE
ncbi:MAG TPA: xanthine dehydrogenase [Treponema sp.]|nr:xanthine dehydrogenase [Treponema sp.]